MTWNGVCAVWAKGNCRWRNSTEWKGRRWITVAKGRREEEDTAAKNGMEQRETYTHF